VRIASHCIAGMLCCWSVFFAVGFVRFDFVLFCFVCCGFFFGLLLVLIRRRRRRYCCS
jgi:hypothetical protein